MKTRLATLTACVAAIALLSGCFGSAEKAPAPQPEAQPAQTQSAPEQAAEPAAAEPAAAEPEGPYLYNLLEDQPAKKAWARMTASRKGAPAWIRKGEGPTSPAEEALINGKRYWQGSVCEQHNCPNTFFFLLGETKACMPTLRTANPPRSAPCTTARRPPLRRPPCAKPLKLNASARWPTNKSHLPA